MYKYAAERSLECVGFRKVSDLQLGAIPNVGLGRAGLREVEEDAFARASVQPYST